MKHEPELSRFRELPAPILSVFLNTAAPDASRHPLVQPGLAWFEEQSAAIGKGLRPREGKQFYRQAERVKRFLVGRHPQEKALVIFAGPKTWKQISLPVAVENELCWGEPRVMQLFDLYCEYPSYGVVLLDHSRVRSLIYRFGKLTQSAERRFEIDRSQWKRKDQGRIAAEHVQKSRGPQRDLYERRIEAQYARLCRTVAKETLEFSLRNDLVGIFLVGPDKLIHAVHDGLPQSYGESAVLVSENLEKDSPRQLLQRLEPFFEAYKERGEIAEVERVQAAAGRTAITDPDEVLARLQNEEIHTLVAAREFNPDLQECTVCGTASRSADPVCALCRGTREKTNLRELLAQLVDAGQKFNIEFVSGTAAELLMRTGALGGWLREAKASAAD
jgi:Bacterial archaeo-eukaryotic release factor family 10